MTTRVAKRAKRTASAALLAAGLLLAIQAAAATAACPNETERQRQGATHLPDCRAYEMVTPPDKNGGEPIPFASRMSVARDGSAIVFDSLTPFGDAIGTGTDVDYMAVRGSDGWATHALTPYQTAPSFEEAFYIVQPSFLGPYTPDLSKGIFKSRSPVLSAPEDHANVAHVENLYLASDLRTPGGAQFNLISDAYQPLPDLGLGWLKSAWPAGATEDLGTVLFESLYRLTADAPPGTADRKLYKWSAAAGLRPVAQVPPGAERSCGDGGPACVNAAASVAGPGTTDSQFHMFNTLSDDGSRAFFTVARGNTPWADSTAAGDLYMRDDRGTPALADDATVKLNASERTPADAFDSAFFWYASSDGERAAFSSAEALTEDAPDDGTQKLYLWSATLSEAGEHLTLLNADAEPADGFTSLEGVIGGSEDGRTIYFFSWGQLVAGQPPLPGAEKFGIYRWREGEGLRFLGKAVNKNDVFYAVNRSFNNKPQNINSRVSADGEKLLLSLRQAPLEGLPYDHSEACEAAGNPNRGCEQLYLFDVGAAAPVCVSCLPGGQPSDKPSFFGSPAHGVVEHLGSPPVIRPALLNNPVDESFSRVFFTSGLPLDPRDTNGRYDAYEYDVASEEVALLSSGESKRDSFFMNATPDGSSAFFLTNERLVGWDVDASRDLYAVRVGGGLPEPTPPVPSCEGDACQPAASAPGVQTPASAGFRATPPQPAARVACVPLARRAARLIRRARALRRKARRAARPRAARRMRRGARRLDHRAKRIGKRGRLCRARGGRR
jgi:hypothetical protein